MWCIRDWNILELYNYLDSIAQCSHCIDDWNWLDRLAWYVPGSYKISWMEFVAGNSISSNLARLWIESMQVELQVASKCTIWRPKCTPFGKRFQVVLMLLPPKF